MKSNKVNTVISALAVAAMFNWLGSTKPAEAASIQLIGLTDNNTLVSFNANNSSRTRSVSVTGVNGNLIGIDFRPADGLLYGVTLNRIYKIDPMTGVATEVPQNPATPFALSGNSFGVDFNPNPDRIRVVSDAEQNLRLNPNNNGGLAGSDTALAYAAGDPNEGANPNIVAAAYTNSFPPSPDPTRRTTLYNIDSNLDILVTQGSVNFLSSAPQPPGVSPNTGQLFTVGSLGIDFGPSGGFDIFSTGIGINTAFAASGSSLYSINLANGNATTLGTIGGSVNIIGLSARAVPEPGTVGSLVGLTVLSLLSRFCSRVKLPS